MHDFRIEIYRNSIYNNNNFAIEAYTSITVQLNAIEYTRICVRVCECASACDGNFAKSQSNLFDFELIS